LSPRFDLFQNGLAFYGVLPLLQRRTTQTQLEELLELLVDIRYCDKLALAQAGLAERPKRLYFTLIVFEALLDFLGSYSILLFHHPLHLLSMVIRDRTVVSDNGILL
jgi:hypothetical protein